MRQPGFREVLAMKAHARMVLNRLIPVFAMFGPAGKHFKGSHASQFQNPLNLMSQMSPHEGTRKAAKQSSGQMQAFTDVGYRMMEHIAKKTVMPNTDLDALTEVLNQARGQIRFQRDDSGRDPYRRETQHIAIDFAEDLLAYINLATLYGPEHDICEQCGALMIAGRGGKKFCSPECRNAFWNYGRQKKSYAQKRKIALKGGKQ